MKISSIYKKGIRNWVSTEKIRFKKNFFATV